MSAPSPGWNPDPTGRHEYRFWDGTLWTDDVSDGGITSVDPVDGGPPPGSEPTQAFGQPPGAYDQGGPPTGAYGGQGGRSTGGYGGQGDPSTGGYGGQGDPSTGGYGGQGVYGSPGPGGYGPQGPPPGGYETAYGGGPGQPPRSGPPSALIIGLVVLGVVVIGGLLAFFLTGDDDGDGDDTATDDTTTTADTGTTEDTGDTPGGPADAFSLEVGDCITDETSMTGEVEEVPIVPCDQPHSSEVYFSYIIPGDDLPDSTEMDSIVTEQCLGQFESFVGLPTEASELLVAWLEPTSGSWDAGDRELLCIVVDPAGNVTGSMQGANR